jgi:hypothetical protein
MTVKDVADLLLAATERVDFYWNFYVVIVIAVIGWLVSLKKALTVPLKVLVSVAYVIAAAMNLLGLYGSYTFAEALRTDLLRMAASAPLLDTFAILEKHSYAAQRTAAFWIHLVVGSAVLLAVWYAKLVVSEPTATPSKNVSEGPSER